MNEHPQSSDPVADVPHQQSRTPTQVGDAALRQGVEAPVRILVLEHDPSDPLLRLGDWLTKAGAVLTVCRPHAGDAVPASLDGFDALISLGGEMGARDDERAPWLPATRALLARAVATAAPTIGVCLGGQLLAAATGGTVRVGDQGPEKGAYLTAKRDAAMSDPLFADLPMTPDVMHYHSDVVTTLPAGAVLLLSSTGYPNQAWRQGPAAWGLQFHIEPSAADVRNWARADGVELTGRLGGMLDSAEEAMGEVWRDFAHRFVAFVRGFDGNLSTNGRSGDHSGTQRAEQPRRLLPVVAVDE